MTLSPIFRPVIPSTPTNSMSPVPPMEAFSHFASPASGRVALVGDAADGYPGIPGIGPVTAAQLLNRHGIIEDFPSRVLGPQRDLALRFKALATLRTDAALFRSVDELLWRGATESFAACMQRMEAPRLLDRCIKASSVQEYGAG